MPVSKESRVVFSCGAREFTVRDVVDAAHFRGEIEPFWRESRRRCQAEARGLEDPNTNLEDAALEEAAIAFRYEHDLITAEETEAWLDARGLTLEDFSAYFARVEWDKIFGGRFTPENPAFEQASAEEREVLVIDLILSGKFDRLAAQLAWRVAASEADPPPQGYGAAGQQEREELPAMEAAYRRRCEQRLTPEALQRELSTVRLPMTRFAVEVVELESRDAAKEAFMCVRDDGMSMQEVAREGRYPFRRMELVLEQVPDEMQQKFLSLTPGSLLEPTPREDGYVLTRLLEKKEPTLDEADVRRRVEQRILQRHFTDLSSGRIQWRILMNGV